MGKLSTYVYEQTRHTQIKRNMVLFVAVLFVVTGVIAVASRMIKPVSAEAGFTWSEQGDGNNIPTYLYDVVSSSNGTKLAALAYNDTYIYTSSDSGATWEPQLNTPRFVWSSIASSADGTKLVAVTNSGEGIYRSTDSGATWTELTGFSYDVTIYKIASSADGTKLAGTSYGDSIYTSDDSGETWTRQEGSGAENWYFIAYSGDGTKIIAAELSGSIFTSSDSGVTWVEAPDSGINPQTEYESYWNMVGSSADGMKLFAGGDRGLFVSIDGGQTWDINTYPDGYYPYDVEVSADGTTLVTAAEGQNIQTSADMGETWNELTNSGSRLWTSVAISSNGSKIVATETEGAYASIDSGVTWFAGERKGVRQWSDIAASSDGVHIIASAVDEDTSTATGYLYMSHDSGATWTQMTDQGNRMWSSVAISDNGTVVATNRTNTNQGEVYISKDNGQTWAAQDTLGSGDWGAVAVTPDGHRIIVGKNYERVYTSQDGGDTWQQSDLSSFGKWKGIAIADDGLTALVVADYGFVRGTSDGGVTWTSRSSNQQYEDVAISADGKTQYAVGRQIIDRSDDFGQNFTSVSGLPELLTNWNSIAVSDSGRQLVVTSDNANSEGDTGYVFTSINKGSILTEQADLPAQNWKAATIDEDLNVRLVGKMTNIWSADFSGSLTSISTAPYNIYASSGGQFTDTYVVWTAPEDDGGADITEYKIEYRLQDSDDDWLVQTFDDVEDQLRAHITGLAASSTYEVRVSATNSVGTSEPSEIGHVSTQGYEIPSSPIGLGAVAGVQSAHLSWEAPWYDGGQLLGYEVQYKQTSSPTWLSSSDEISPSTYSYTVPSLTAGVEYQFRIRAFNSAGQSAWLAQPVTVQDLDFYPWTTGLQDLAMSADATKLVTFDEQYLTVSSDGGQTWTQRTNMPNVTGSLRSVWLSQDGSHMIVTKGTSYNEDYTIEYPPAIYVSSDFGLSWTTADETGEENWQTVTISNDGTKMFATNNLADMFTSTNGGVTWTVVSEHLDESGVTSVAYASDAQTLFAVFYDTELSQTYVKKSTDDGQTWTTVRTTNSPINDAFLTVSSDGTHLLTSTYDYESPGNLNFAGYISRDSGVTWERILDPQGGSLWMADFDENIFYALMNNELYKYGLAVVATPTGNGGGNPDPEPQPEEPVFNVGGTELVDNKVINQRPTFSGIAAPFDAITVTVHSDPVSCSTTADANGYWTCTLPTDLEPGVHSVFVRVTADADGSVIEYGPFIVSVNDPATPPTISAPNTGFLKIAQKRVAVSNARIASTTVSPLLIGAIVISSALVLAGGVTVGRKLLKTQR